MTDLDLDAIRGRQAASERAVAMGVAPKPRGPALDVPALIAEVERLRSERHAASIAALREEAARLLEWAPSDTTAFDAYDRAADYLESLDEEDDDG